MQWQWPRTLDYGVLAQSEDSIARELLQSRPAPLVARGFFDKGDVPKLAACRPSGLVFCQSLLLPLFCFLFEVELDFLAQFGLLVTPLPQPKQLANEGVHGVSLSAGFKINPIAREKVSHFDRSATSCLRPRGVSR